jgi:hypothetical protein
MRNQISLVDGGMQEAAVEGVAAGRGVVRASAGARYCAACAPIGKSAAKTRRSSFAQYAVDARGRAARVYWNQA